MTLPGYLTRRSARLVRHDPLCPQDRGSRATTSLDYADWREKSGSVRLALVVEAAGEDGLALADLAGPHGQPDRATTRRALQRAAELGLLQLAGRGRGARWQPAADLSDPAVWRTAAEHAGVTGRAAMARRRVDVERADYRAHLAETWAHRVEQAERAKDSWRRERYPIRCGASTNTGTACWRPLRLKAIGAPRTPRTRTGVGPPRRPAPHADAPSPPLMRAAAPTATRGTFASLPLSSLR